MSCNFDTESDRVQFHQRIVKKYGKASSYLCTDCNKPALDWSWIHNTDFTDTDNYIPRCRSCHKLYDYTDEYRSRVSAAKIGNGASRGIRNRHAKLNESDVCELREMYATGKFTLDDMADIWALHRMTVHRIVKRIYWKHI